MTAPKVVSAASSNDGRILITFDQAMENNATLNAISSYFVSDTPVGFDEAFIEVTSSTQVTIVLPVDLRIGQSYTVSVSASILNAFSEAMDPAERTAVFLGLGVAPAIKSITVIDKKTIAVLFEEPMTPSLLGDNGNYKITSETTGRELEITNAEVQGSGTYFDEVYLTVTKMTNGGTHELVVSNLTDISENPQNVGHSSSFIGLADLPQITGLDYRGTENIWGVVFDSQMSEHDSTSLAGYSITPDDPNYRPLFYTNAELSDDKFTVYLDISEIAIVNYTVAANTSIVKDIYGNPLDPSFSTSDLDFNVGPGSEEPFGKVLPTLVRISSVGVNRIDLYFSEPMQDGIEIRDISKYVFTGGLSVVEVLSVDKEKVSLAVTSQASGIEYELTLGVPNPPNLLSFTVGGAPGPLTSVPAPGTEVVMTFDATYTNVTGYTDSSMTSSSHVWSVGDTVLTFDVTNSGPPFGTITIHSSDFQDSEITLYSGGP